MTARMNPDVKVRWVAALRSGDYPQTRGALHRLAEEDGGHGWSPGYCCLGVLCELAVQDGITERVPAEGAPYVDAYRSTLDTGEVVAQEAILPREVAAWAGLDSRGFVTLPDGRALTQINDSGTSFADIAALIEQGL